jgi:hypothetical protein
MSSNVVCPIFVLLFLSSLTTFPLMPFSHARITHILAALIALYLFGTAFGFNDVFTARYRAKLFVRVGGYLMIKH